MKRTCFLLVTLLWVGCTHGEHEPGRRSMHQSPYVGEQDRAIKALSTERVQGLLAGDGLGYARAAELNGHPGPRHVLELADSLGLTDAQRRDVEAAFRAMQADAQAAGRALVRTESALDSLFASGAATDDQVQALTAEAAGIEGQVRYAHLAAHVRTRQILNPSQINTYQRLRGYGSGAEHGHHARHEQ